MRFGDVEEERKKVQTWSTERFGAQRAMFGSWLERGGRELRIKGVWNFRAAWEILLFKPWMVGGRRRAVGWLEADLESLGA